MDILVKEYNEVHVKVICDSGIAMELAEHFSFFVPGYKFMQNSKLACGMEKLGSSIPKIIPSTKDYYIT